MHKDPLLADPVAVVALNLDIVHRLRLGAKGQSLHLGWGL
jgi:hypothetical protein